MTSTISRIECRDRPELWFPDRARSDWNMSDRQLAFIEKTAKEAPLPRFLEIGVYHGVTTTLLAQIGIVVAVDWFEGNPEYASEERESTAEDLKDRLEGFLANLRLQGIRRKITTIVGRSEDALPALSAGQFGLVLVDADHSEAAAQFDMEQAWRLLVPGGWLMLDDFSHAIVRGVDSNPVERAFVRFCLKYRAGDLSGETADELPPKLVRIRKPVEQMLNETD